jgi:surface polysaccharide O-acyltransferase-like enzyme
MSDRLRRILWVDLVRVVAVFAVVLLHVAAYPVTQMGRISGDQWWWANAYDSLARPAVPLFVMLSGALLLPQKAWNAGYFIRHRLGRVAGIFIAWCLVYALWNYDFHGKLTTINEFVFHVLAGMRDPIASHLWFLPLIFSLYLFVPVLRVYVTNSSFMNQFYFACLWVVASIFQPAIESHAFGYYLDPAYGYVGYFVLGATCWIYLPGRLDARWLILCGTGFVLGYAVTVFGTYWLAVRNGGRLDEYFYGHYSLNVIIMTVAAFILLRDAGLWLQMKFPEPTLVLRFVTFAGVASFGIYLIHIIVFDVLNSSLLGFKLGALSFHTAGSIPTTAVAIFLISLMVTKLMQKSRLLRWLVP